MRNKENLVMKMATTQIRIIFVKDWFKIRENERTTDTTKISKKNKHPV